MLNKKIKYILIRNGGNVWESNPPGLFLDLSGFEGRGAHRDNIRFR